MKNHIKENAKILAYYSETTILLVAAVIGAIFTKESMIASTILVLMGIYVFFYRIATPPKETEKK